MDPLRLSATTIAALILVTFVLGLADIHRRHERVLLGNLGVTHTMLGVFLAGPALAGELTLLLVSSAR